VSAPPGPAVAERDDRPPVPGLDEAAWRRLSPRMLIVHPVRELVRALPVLAGVLVAGTTTGQGGWWGTIGAGIAMAVGVLRWFTTTYRIAGGQLQVRRGLLQRQVTGVPLDRVRTVDVTVSVLHRVLGLARVSIGTGQSDRGRGSGLRLDGLSAAEAARLRDELLVRDQVAAAGRPAAERELARAEPSWVRYGPFTLSGALAVLAIAGFAWRISSEAHIDPTRLQAVGANLRGLVPAWVVFVVLPLAGLFVVGAASTIGYVLAFWRFRLVRLPGGSLQVTRGLVTTRATTIEERRLRGVELSEPALLRIAGGARCIAIATGLRVGRGAERGGSLLLPPAPSEVARRVAAEVLGAAEPVAAPLTRHGVRALRRRFTRLALVWVPVAAVLLVLWRVVELPAWTWELWLGLALPGALLAADRYRSLGHALAGRTLVTAWGSLVRRRCMLACDGVVGWNLHRSFFQRRVGLATLVATTAAGRQQYRVQDVDLAEALRVASDAVPGLLTPFLVEGDRGD
jgi:putative membrane protein